MSVHLSVSGTVLRLRGPTQDLLALWGSNQDLSLLSPGIPSLDWRCDPSSKIIIDLYLGRPREPAYKQSANTI